MLNPNDQIPVQLKINEIMTVKNSRNCLYCSILLIAMLFFQGVAAQSNFKPIDHWLNANLQSLGGRAVILIYKDGKIVYQKAVNNLSDRQKIGLKLMARRQGKPTDEVLQDLTENTKINIASCSKWLSAALVMTFVDEGKLALKDSIGKYLPIMSLHGKGSITIEQCLSHTTGIEPGNMKDEIKEFTGAASMDDVMQLIADKPMEAAPGKSFHYSSVGLQVAAAVIEKISGKDFETLFAERIALPCAMSQTDFGHKTIPLPAGGARSTAKDYLNFLTMILHKGKFNGKEVLKEKSIILMQQNYTSGLVIKHSPAEAGKWGYGFGEWVINDSDNDNSSDAVTSPGLFGSFPYFNNQLNYAAVLFTVNLNNKGRHERYSELKKLADDAIRE